MTSRLAGLTGATLESAPTVCQTCAWWQSRGNRDADKARGSVEAVERAAREGANVMPPIVDAIEARATVGEIADALRRVYGEHSEVKTL